MMRNIIFVTVCSWLILLNIIPPSVTSAHAFLQKAVPAQESSLDSSPSEIRMTFTEPINASFSSIRVIAENGESIQNPLVSIDSFTVSMPIPSLRDGVYIVEWQMLSVDTHVSDHRYRFAVGQPLPANIHEKAIEINDELDSTATNSTLLDQQSNSNQSSVPSANPQSISSETNVPTTSREHIHGNTQEHSNVVASDDKPHHHPSSATNTHNHSAGEWLHIVHQWLRVLDVLLIVFVGGYLFFRSIIVGALPLRRISVFHLRWERRLYLGALFISLFSGMLHMWHLSSQLAPLHTTNDGHFIGQLAMQTLLGQAILFKVVAFSFLYFTTFLSIVRKPAWDLGKFGVLISLVVLFPLTGHAYAASPFQISSIVFHFLHLATLVCWVGGLLGLTMFSWIMLRSNKQLHVFAKMMQRFAAWALPLLLISTMSGVASSLDKFTSWEQWFSTTYGFILLSKLSVTMFIFAVAAWHRLWWLPRLHRLEEDERARVRPLIVSLRIELLLAKAALILGALLAMTPPPM